MWAVEPFTGFIAEWDEFRTYFVKNLDFTNYRIATYSKASGELIAFYQGDIVEDNDNQTRIDAHGSAVWGPILRLAGRQRTAHQAHEDHPFHGQRQPWPENRDRHSRPVEDE